MQTKKLVFHSPPSVIRSIKTPIVSAALTHNLNYRHRARYIVKIVCTPPRFSTPSRTSTRKGWPRKPGGMRRNSPTTMAVARRRRRNSRQCFTHRSNNGAGVGPHRPGTTRPPLPSPPILRRPAGNNGGDNNPATASNAAPVIKSRRWSRWWRWRLPGLVSLLIPEGVCAYRGLLFADAVGGPRGNRPSSQSCRLFLVGFLSVECGVCVYRVRVEFGSQPVV